MPFRRRNAVDDRLEDLLDADAVLGAGEDAFAAFHHQQLLDLAHHALGIGGRQIDLVDHRNDRQVVLEREMIVGQRLRLDALRGIDDEHRAFAGRQRARDFVREIDVSGRVDQVELVLLAVARSIVERNRVHANRDAALALEVHRVERLLFEVSRRDGARDLEQPVGERRLAVIDVRDDAEVANVARDFDAVRAIGFEGQAIKV